MQSCTDLLKPWMVICLMYPITAVGCECRTQQIRPCRCYIGDPDGVYGRVREAQDMAGRWW